MQDKTKASAPRKEPPPPPSRGGKLERRLKVRSYCSMKQQRVYPLTIEVEPAAGGPAQAAAYIPVTIRPIIAGAQVTPLEQRLDLSQPRALATFQVTPLARGRLSEARVEVHQQGQQIDQVRLRMKSTTQRRTWLLAALTLLLPWFLILITSERYWKLRGSVPGKPPELNADPGEILEHRIKSWSDSFVPKIPQLREYGVNPLARGLGIGYSWTCNLLPDHLPFWVGTALLSLTALSWVSNRSQRTSRRKPLARLVIPSMQAEAETLPLSAREQAPQTVLPVE